MSTIKYNFEHLYLKSRREVSYMQIIRVTTCTNGGRKNAIWQQFGQLAIRSGNRSSCGNPVRNMRS